MKRVLHVFCVVFCMLFAITLNAQQWEQTSGPTGGWVQHFAVSGNNIVIGGYHRGIFLSTDTGASWTEVDPA